MSRHPVNPRRQRNAKRPNPRRRSLRRPTNPTGNLTGDDRFGAGVCRVGELLVPALGLARVQTIAGEGGLLPYLAHRLVARVAALLGAA